MYLWLRSAQCHRRFNDKHCEGRVEMAFMMVIVMVV